MGGGYVFPDFLPAYDAMASLCKLLELLAPSGSHYRRWSRSSHSTLVHRQLPCPWSHKGAVMRVLTERLKGGTSISSTGSRSPTAAAGRRCYPIRMSRSSIYAEGRDQQASNELEESSAGSSKVLHDEAEISS